MKELLRFMLPLAALCVLALSSCSKDDDNGDSRPNALKIGDKNREIVSGRLINYGQQNGLYKFGMFLHSKGYNPTGEDPIEESAAIYFEIFTTSPDGPAPGTYTSALDESLDDPQVEREWILGYNSSTQEIYVKRDDAGEIIRVTIKVYGMETGTLLLARNGDDYELRFDGIKFDSRAVSGYYKGRLTDTSPDEFE